MLFKQMYNSCADIMPIPVVTLKQTCDIDCNIRLCSATEAEFEIQIHECILFKWNKKAHEARWIFKNERLLFLCYGNWGGGGDDKIMVSLNWWILLLLYCGRCPPSLSDFSQILFPDFCLFEYVFCRLHFNRTAHIHIRTKPSGVKECDERRRSWKKETVC